jgi:CheY-like chemotaxis protein
VEDEALVALDVAQQVEDLGHEVVGPVFTLAPAMSLAETEDLDFALLDLDLRGERSLPVAEILAARSVPFAFLSGYHRPDLPEALRAARLLSKPVRPGSLVEILGGATPDAPPVSAPGS